MNKIASSGSSLLYIIAAMLALSSIGAGIAVMSSSGTMADVSEINRMKAYYLAASGLNYSELHPSASSVTVTVGTNSRFSYSTSGTTSTSLGVANAGLGNEASFRLAGIQLGSLNPIIPGFKDWVKNINVDDAITTSSDYSEIYFGTSHYDTSGTIIYSGNLSNGVCSAGMCAFNDGIRVYFKFKFLNVDNSSDSHGYADGFTFFVMTTNSNSTNSMGGPSSGSRGEFLGYAGPGSNNTGLKPPKMAIEIDTYPNNGDGADWDNFDSDQCRWDNENQCPDIAVNSRRDNAGASNMNANHIALLFWGNNNFPTSCASLCTRTRCRNGTCSDPYSYVMCALSIDNDTDCPSGVDLYDDNRHDEGGLLSSPVTPLNSYYISNAAGDGYYQKPKVSGQPNWLEDNVVHTFRLDISRSTGSGGSGQYVVKTWIDCSNCDDVTQAFSGSGALINKSFTLDSSYHNLLGSIYLGFSEGTGGGTQYATISDFAAFIVP